MSGGIGYYQLWADAQAAAFAAGGYLATITSFDENDFITRPHLLNADRID